MASSESKGGFMGFVNRLIPHKGDGVGEIIRKIVFLVSFVVLIVMAVIILNNFLGSREAQKDNDEIADIFHSADIQIDTTKREELDKEFPEVQEQFLPLLEKNKDTVGWINITGTNGDKVIDYPVLQCGDNDYYLTRDFYGRNRKSGAIFADCYAPITAESQPANIVLYGHNMLDGSMFAMLTRYFNYKTANHNDITYYKEHPTITFSTLYDTSTYKIFAGMMTNTEEIGGEVFDYHVVHDFGSKAEFEDYCGKILDRSTFYTPDVDLQYGDEILTLSTCILGYTDRADTRFVIFARKTREGESETVDVEKAYANPDPLFYDMYYDVYGGEWGGRKWDPALIKGYEGTTE